MPLEYRSFANVLAGGIGPASCSNRKRDELEATQAGKVGARTYEVFDDGKGRLASCYG